METCRDEPTRNQDVKSQIVNLLNMDIWVYYVFPKLVLPMCGFHAFATLHCETSTYPLMLPYIQVDFENWSYNCSCPRSPKNFINYGQCRDQNNWSQPTNHIQCWSDERLRFSANMFTFQGSYMYNETGNQFYMHTCMHRCGYQRSCESEHDVNMTWQYWQSH